jgi:hypothetical protein
MTPRLQAQRGAVVAAGAGLLVLSAAIACTLNPQPLPPTDLGVKDTPDASVGQAADAGLAAPSPSDAAGGSFDGDAQQREPDGASDAGPEAGGFDATSGDGDADAPDAG